MFYYIFQIILFQLLFLIAYDIFHKKDTFFSLNRAYLLCTSILSFVLPFIKIKSIQENIPEEYVVELPTVFIGQKPIVAPATEVINTINTASVLDTINWWLVLYALVVAILLFRFIRKTIKLKQLRSSAFQNKIGDLNVVILPESKDAFSFWNTIYLGDQLSETEKEQILVHEIVHIQQKHSLDLLWFELLKMVFWFNPLIYVYQSRIKALHEFLADAKSVKNLGKRKYYEQLLNTVFDTEEIKFINQFYSRSLIKKRILMLQKSKSKTIARYKYLVLIPILGFMLVFSSFSQKGAKKIVENASQKQVTYSPVNVALNDSLDKILKKRLRQELQKMIDANVDSRKITNTFLNQDDNRFFSREAYYRNQIFNEFLVTRHIEEKKQTDTISSDEKERINQYLKNTKRSYEEHRILARKANERYLKGEDRDIVRQLEKIIKEIENGSTNFSIQAKRHSEDLNSKENGGAYTITKETPFDKHFIQRSFSLNEGEISAPFKTKLGWHIVTVEKRQGETINLRHILIKKKTEFPFAKVDKIPTTKTCKNIVDPDEMKECVINELNQFVKANFDVNIAQQKGLSGLTSFHVNFKIDTIGNITNIRSRAPLPELKQEAVRVIGSLPKMIPGESNGIRVDVLFSLPIVINIPENEKAVGDNNTQKKPSKQEEEPVLTENLSDITGHNIENGYYLVTNIFKRKSYLDKGVARMKKSGLNPKVFRNPKDKYYYVYLEKYDSLEKAKEMLFTDMNNTYTGDLYILKIITK
ncbi:peptidylprolyl isomerase [Aquimarina sp. 2201CG5-10]|uniref:peptidylprolyl isomerase n=1 Tax=Aquimarina callyspongiae TaxID=3098150 RepID=UPI002AB378CC|nr:peptidylprolyl isomerase [Aquimarina sp. 2201CG5-10]MDY8134811.1 peptidylprolyl isomerase [Aquimarina sp. 2201CG5-10]